MTEAITGQSIPGVLQSRFHAAVLASAEDKGGDWMVTLKNESLPAVLAFLKQEQGYNVLSDMIGLDQGGEQRFAVLYVLTRIPGGERLRLQVNLAENEAPSSVVSIYKSADWAEREIYDMFGITFAGHPNLKRIYMEDAFTGFPLRKDFPLAGE